jgi:hypothetical protein
LQTRKREGNENSEKPRGREGKKTEEPRKEVKGFSK